jgi:hypothetical protein
MQNQVVATSPPIASTRIGGLVAFTVVHVCAAAFAQLPELHPRQPIVITSERAAAASHRQRTGLLFAMEPD